MKKTFTWSQRVGLWQTLFAREWIVYQKRMGGLLINLIIVQPLTFSLVQGYIKPLMYFGDKMGRTGSFVLYGAVLMPFIHRSFSFAMALFFDLHTQKNILFQRQWVPDSIIYSVRLVFSILLAWLMMIPLLPLAKLYLQEYLYTVDAQWHLLFPILGVITAMMVSYAFMCISIARSLHDVTKIRVRANEILMWLGGFNVPWFAMYQSWHGWGYIALINPFVYATEAVRQVMVPGPEFFPFSTSITALAVWTLLFSYIGYRFFRQGCMNRNIC